MAETLSGDEQFPVIARFEIRRRAYLAPDGTGLRRLPSFAYDIALLVSFYRAMVLARAFDLKAVSLQRTGRLGTYAVALGQEAVGVGIASAMREEDVLLPSYRDNAALLWRGVKMEEILMIFHIAFLSVPRRRMPRGSLTRSSSEKSRGLPFACSATAPLRRVTYGKR